VLELSLTEALKLGHNYIGTELLLLGLVGESESEGEGVASWILLALGREKEGVAIRVPLKFGADPKRIRNEVLRMLSGQAPTPSLGFFESSPIPPDPPAARRYRTPEWMGPPENVVPGVAALELLLVNLERHAVWIGQVEVYPTGALLRVDLHGREPAPPGPCRHLQWPRGRRLSGPTSRLLLLVLDVA
jgi:Clp amino terminal domain, pathogenicity island component